MRSIGPVVLVVASLMCLPATVASAQSSSTSTDIKSFEVIAVSGNNVVVKLPEGTRELTVPESFRFTVDGMPITVQELKPGMTGTATITTRTTMVPVTVTEVKGGTVAQVGGSSIVLRTDEGLRSFSQSEVDKRGVTILRDGKPAQLSDFHVGDRLTATIVTSKPPEIVTERDVQASVAAAPAQPPERAALPSAPAAVGTSGAQATPADQRTLPRTAGVLPLLALGGLASVAVGATLTVRRRRLTR